MHIAIDRQALKFLPIKHESIFVIADLLWIEAPLAHAHVVPVNHMFLDDFTDLELMSLYKNTTDSPALYVSDKMRCVLFEIAERIPVREVNEVRLSAQADMIPAQSSQRYVYNHDGFKPLEMGELFKLERVKMCRAENESILALKPRTGPAAPLPKRTSTPAPISSEPRAQREVSAPRQGGVAQLVWSVADAIWQEAGSPKDIKIILKLRKDMMNILEQEHSIKKTSSSNELGKWMLSRI